MSYIKYKGSNEVQQAKVTPRGNIVTLSFTGVPVVSTAGFEIFLDAACEMRIGNYLAYTTVYRNDEITAAYNGYQLSNDGAVYVAPVQPLPTVTFSTGAGGSLSGNLNQGANDYSDLTVPTPIPDENYVFTGWVPEIPAAGAIGSSQRFQATFQYVQTLEEVQEQKIVEINAAQQAVIAAGVNVTLTDGTVEHFTLTDHDQTSLMGLQSQVMAGEQMIPWHTSDEAEHCKFYSNADMALITAAALAYVTWHVTYFRDLRIYIRSLADKEAVAAVAYGMEIPETFRSEPLQAMMAAQSV
ncbi:MAG: hypothetical protein Q4C58_14210 [Eubacteriales bacterium]|nr:hypothetical protein [Eubacteriales bacterium]